jgi:proline iminopeptidase
LIVRGIFMARPEELHWFYQEGASRLFPDIWEQYLAPIPKEEHGDLISAYHKRLTGDDPAVQLRAAHAWSQWESNTITLLPSQNHLDAKSSDKAALAFARIENHYFMNQGFLEPDQLLKNAHRLHGIPGVIVQGRYDVCTPAHTAWQLHRAWPQAEFHMVADAGHAYDEPGILAKLLAATQKFAI